MGRCDDVHVSLHREITTLVAGLGSGTPRNLLDVGCWDGRRTQQYAQAAGLSAENVYGLEYFADMAVIASRSFNCRQLDIEGDAFPFGDLQFDLVVCNQVMEHCKNIFHPLSEIHRVMRVGGRLIFSVPNLASLHNRVMLAFGHQPSSIRVMGPHVRGFTHRAVRRLLEFNGLFSVEVVVGVGFYPLPASIGDGVGRRFPGMSHTPVISAVKTAADAETWEAAMRVQGEQTAFFADSP